MKNVSVLGIDLAKSVFQVHGVDKTGRKVLAKRFTRKQLVEFMANLPICIVAMEACGGSHFWARKFLSLGHDVKLIAPQFVKPFVKSNKNDANDAEAICEAASRPSMRFVAVKSVDQQALLCLHRVRERTVAARVALMNEIRGLLNEFGIVIPKGKKHLRVELPIILEGANDEFSERARRIISGLHDELLELNDRVDHLDGEIANVACSDDMARTLRTVPGIGPLTATAFVATIGSAKSFRNGREVSSFLGLVPRQSSSGGKTKLLGISKRGDRYLRKLLVHGARSACKAVESRNDRQAQWLKSLIKRRGMNKAAVALANKNARILWALMISNKPFEYAA